MTRFLMVVVGCATLGLACTIPLAALASSGGGGGGGSTPSDSGPMYDPAVEYQKGMEAISNGKWKDAQRAFNNVTDAAPKAFEGWFMLGYAKASGGDPKGARRAYDRAVKLKPEDIAAHRELAITLARIGETEKARSELVKLQGRAATCAEACPDAALLKSGIAAIETALAPHSDAVQPTPQSFLVPPRPDQGDQAYADALKLVNQGRLNDAWAALGKAELALGPHPDILTYKGYVRRRMGETGMAEDYYRQALAMAPEHRGALEYYGELKVLQGDLAGARRLLARLDQVCAFGCPEAEELRRWIATGTQPS
jgi:Flp pilus assembly protein TadD